MQHKEHTMPRMTINDLADFVTSFKAILVDTYGFDNVGSPYVMFKNDCMNIQFYCYEKWSKHSDSLTVYVTISLTEEDQKPKYKIEPQWRRELRYLSEQSANIIEHQDAFATEAGKRFVQDMLAKRDEIAGLLTED
jgi:hypothetical protein